MKARKAEILEGAPHRRLARLEPVIALRGEQLAPRCFRNGAAGQPLIQDLDGRLGLVGDDRKVGIPRERGGDQESH
jgi:hypothetical protein